MHQLPSATMEQTAMIVGSESLQSITEHATRSTNASGRDAVQVAVIVTRWRLQVNTVGLRSVSISIVVGPKPAQVCHHKVDTV